MSKAEVDFSIDSSLTYFEKYKYHTPDSTLDVLLEIQKEELTNLQQGRVNEIFGDLMWYKSLFDSSIYYYEKNVELYTKMDSIRFTGHMYADIGYVYMDLKQFTKSIDYYQRAFQIGRKYKDANLIYLATVYKGQLNEELGNYEEALKTYMEALADDIELNNQRNVAIIHNNVTSIYLAMGKYEEALASCEESWRLWEPLGEELGRGYYYGNKGTSLSFLGRYEEAEEYLLKSIKLNQKLGKMNVVFSSLITLMDIYLDRKQEKEFKVLLDKFKALMRQTPNIKLRSDYYNAASGYFKMVGQMDSAYYFLDKYIIIKDSILDLKKQQQITSLSAQFDADKKEYDLKLLQAEHDKDQLMIQKQNIQLYFTLGGGGVFLVLSILAFVSYRQKRKANVIISEQNEELSQTNEELAAQRDEIETQKNKLEEAHSEIRHSINYAKRIQEAILPSMDTIQKHLPHSYVLYKPKDVVAGDFYWLEKNDNGLYVAAADCTGHGVPGAMVSVVCSNALTKAVMEEEIADVGQVLDRTREIVVEKLAKSNEVKDVMDISLARIDLKEMKMDWAGANNPLYLIRKGELQITKGDREPIGQTERPTPFTRHHFELLEGDNLIFFTDGYADQFGGSEGRKLGYRNFRAKLEEISVLPITQHQEQLNAFFEEWKGSEEQLDDVCVIGIKV